MAKILLCGAPVRNKLHGAEVGVVDALRQLGHSVALLDFGAGISIRTDGGSQCNGLAEQIVSYIQDDYDFILTMGAGIPNAVYEHKTVRNFFKQYRSILWCSEPIRIESYRSRIAAQTDIFDTYFSFDEGECAIYTAVTGKPCFFLPQAGNPEWYRPLDNRNRERLCCFVGSISNKWCNRQYFLDRVRKVVPPTNMFIATIFDANKVNELYNKSAFVLNLGLYHPGLGSGPTYLASYGFQQRIFESLCAGSIPFTNIPADMSQTPQQAAMFENGKTIVYYNNHDLEAVLKHYIYKPDKINEMLYHIRQIRSKHTYLARMQQLMTILEGENAKTT